MKDNKLSPILTNDEYLPSGRHQIDEDHANYSSPPQRQKKPGPRPNPCIWCGETHCSHCQCTGHPKCDHKAGEPCSRPRYQRRLVCNPCEKNKLKDEPGRKGSSRPSSSQKTPVTRRKTEGKHIGMKSSSVDSLLNPRSSSRHHSMETLIRIVSQELDKGGSGNRLSTPGTSTSVSSTFQNDEIGLSVDIFNSNHQDREGSPSGDGAAEVASYHSGQSTPSQTYTYPTPQSYGNLSSYPQLPPSRPYPSSPPNCAAAHSFDSLGRPLPNMQNNSFPEKPEAAPFTHAYGPMPYGPMPYGPAVNSPGGLTGGSVQGRTFFPPAGNEYDGQPSLEMLQLIAKYVQRDQEESTSSQCRPATPVSSPSSIQAKLSTHQHGQNSMPDLPATTSPQPVSTSLSPIAQPRFSPTIRHAHHLSQDGVLFQSSVPPKMMNSCSTQPLAVMKEEQQQQGVEVEMEMEMEMEMEVEVKMEMEMEMREERGGKREKKSNKELMKSCFQKEQDNHFLP